MKCNYYKEKFLFFIILILVLGFYIFNIFVLLHESKDTIVDDSYITFRYAKNLANGNGIVFNPGERVEGYSSVLWVLILAIGFLFNLDIRHYSIILGIIFNGFVIVYVMLKLFELLKEYRFKIIWAAIAGLIIAGNYRYVRWSVYGMEFPLYILLVLLLYETFFKSIKTKKIIYPLITTFIGCILILTRPEAPLYLFLMGIVFLIFHKSFNNDFSKKHAAIIFSVNIIFFILYLIWRKYYYGWWLPNTFYCKVDMGTDYITRGFFYFASTVDLSRWWILLVLSLLIIKSNAYKSPQQFLWFITIFFLIVYYIYVGGDLYKERLLLPIFPIILIVSVISLAKIKFIQKYNFHSFLLICIAYYIINPQFITKVYRNTTLSTKTNFSAWHLTGKWLKEEFPKNTVMASCAVGIIPYLSQFNTIDILGLCNAEIAHQNIKKSDTLPGHNKFNIEYVISQNPNIITTHFDGIDRYDIFKNNKFIQNYLLLALVNNDVISDKPPIKIIAQDKSGENLQNNILWDDLRKKGYKWGIFIDKNLHNDLSYYFAPYETMPLNDKINLNKDNSFPPNFTMKILRHGDFFLQDIELSAGANLCLIVEVKTPVPPQILFISLKSKDEIIQNKLVVERNRFAYYAQPFSIGKNDTFELRISNYGNAEIEIKSIKILKSCYPNFSTKKIK